MAIDQKLVRHLDSARACLDIFDSDTVDVAILKVRWNLEAISLLVTADAAITKALVVARRNCLKLLEHVRAEDHDERELKRALGSLDRLQQRLEHAKPSSAARRLGVSW